MHKQKRRDKIKLHFVYIQHLFQDWSNVMNRSTGFGSLKLLFFVKIRTEKTPQFLEKFCGVSGIAIEHLIPVLTFFEALQQSR
jgi:hypothetical protein